MSKNEVEQILSSKMPDIYNRMDSDKYLNDFCFKLQMIFDNSTGKGTVKVNTPANDDEGYVLDNNVKIKSTGDSFHDMFDSERSVLVRNIDTFQELLLAKFVGNFVSDDESSNIDLCYKLLQIYIMCFSEFFDKNGSPRDNVEGNRIAQIIFRTVLTEYDSDDVITSDVITDQFTLMGSIIEFNPDFKYQDNIIANILFGYFNKRSNDPEKKNILILSKIIEFSTANNLQGLVNDSYQNSYSEITNLLISLYDAKYIITRLISFVNKYLRDNSLNNTTVNGEFFNNFIKFLYDSLTTIREYGRSYVPSINSCFPYLYTNHPSSCDIRQLHKENNFNNINDENTNLLIGGRAVIVPDFYKSSSMFISNVSKNQNKVTISKTVSCELDEAPDAFSKPIVEINRNTNTNIANISDFITEEDNILFKTKENKKLFSYIVNKKIITSEIYELIEQISEISYQIIDNPSDVLLEQFLATLEQLNNYDPKLYSKITERIVELKQQTDKTINKKIIIDVLKSKDWKNYIGIIHKVVKDEFSRCELGIILHNSPFISESEVKKITVISVNNMSSEINIFLNKNSNLQYNKNFKKDKKKQLEYIKNLLEIDARLRGKAVGDILPTLSTLPIVIKNNRDHAETPITCTIVTSGDENAILNLLLLAKLNQGIFDRVLILTSNNVSGNQNEVAIRIGNNTDIFNEYNHGKLDSLLKYGVLKNILDENTQFIRDIQQLQSQQTPRESPSKNHNPETQPSPDKLDNSVVEFLLNSKIFDRDEILDISDLLYLQDITDMNSLTTYIDELKSVLPLKVFKKIKIALNPPNRGRSEKTNEYDSRTRSRTRDNSPPEGPGGASTNYDPSYSDVSENLFNNGSNSSEYSRTNFQRIISPITVAKKEIDKIVKKAENRKKGGSRKHHIQTHKTVTRRKNKKSPKRKTIKKRKMPKRKNKTRRNK